MVQTTLTALLLAVLATSSATAAGTYTLAPAGSGSTAASNLDLLMQYVNALEAGTLSTSGGNPIYTSPSQTTSGFNRRSRSTADEYYTSNGNSPVLVNAGMTPAEAEAALRLHNLLQGAQAGQVVPSQASSSQRRRRLRAVTHNQGPVLVNAGMTPAEMEAGLRLHNLLQGQGIPAAQVSPSETNSGFNRRSRNIAEDYYTNNGNGPVLVNAGMTPVEAEAALRMHNLLQGIPASQAQVSPSQTNSGFNRRNRNTVDDFDYGYGYGYEYDYDSHSSPFVVNAGMTAEEEQFAINAHNLLGNGM